MLTEALGILIFVFVEQSLSLLDVFEYCIPLALVRDNLAPLNTSARLSFSLTSFDAPTSRFRVQGSISWLSRVVRISAATNPLNKPRKCHNQSSNGTKL
jgi:hypothetical protein